MEFSAATFFASLVVSSVGFGIFRYGKAQERAPQYAVGLAMMIYPYCVTNALALWGIAAAMICGLIAAVRAGW